MVHSESVPTCHVVAMPYPGRGHINPMLNLCRLLLSRSPLNLLISVVVTEEWLGLLNAADLPPSPSNLRFVTIPNVLPSEIGRAKDFKGFIHAVCTKLVEPFERVLDHILPKVDAILYDTFLAWVVPVGNRRNIPVCSMYPMCASFFSAFYHFDKIQKFAVTPGPDGQVPKNTEYAREADEPLGKYIPGHNSLKLSDLHYILTSATRDHVIEAFAMLRKAQCVIFTNFYELESRVIDSLREHMPCPVYPIGPSIPYMAPKTTTTPAYVEWLDSQPKQSVLYVSLGSFLTVSDTQMDELAFGLQLSGTPFLWVARGDASRLQEMVGDKGRVIPWCDQMRVLKHPSVGGFLTHCGWNSTMEGVFCGIPMLTLPIFMDQAVDSRLIVDEWKIGYSLRKGVGKDVGKEEIAEAVKKLMDLDGVESKEMRERAKELSDTAHGATEIGGSSLGNLDSLLKIFSTAA